MCNVTVSNPRLVKTELVAKRVSLLASYYWCSDRNQMSYIIATCNGAIRNNLLPPADSIDITVRFYNDGWFNKRTLRACCTGITKTKLGYMLRTNLETFTNLDVLNESFPSYATKSTIQLDPGRPILQKQVPA